MEAVILLILLSLLIILLLVILAIFSLYIVDIFLPVPFVASKNEVVKKMVRLAEIKKGDKVFDLGSGDGRLVIEAAKIGANVVGVEANPFLVLLSRLKIKLAKVPAQIIFGNIFKQNLSQADVIFLYLTPKLLVKLAPKIKKEVKNGTKIVSNTYEIPGFKPIKTFDKILFYEI